MPVKKKAGKKKAGKKSTKAPAGPPVAIYSIPAYKENKDDIKSIDVTLRLAAPIAIPLDFITKVAPNCKFSTLQQIIAENHGGSIDSLSICLHRYHKDNKITDLSQSFKDFGIFEGDCMVYYDFEPVVHPLLIT
eukprot:GILI01010246.1.p2 GENE.GILI01010246.1~~GILI01010246.1.p2  ORF type:complete len:134 (+),score=35.87 GILI01010246.1:42-443(+)